MASAAATSTMSHSLPPLPMAMAYAPRIRPPRIPKGTPNANTNPQPEGPRPGKLVWVQGKWRDPASRAARHRQQIYSRRVEKALKHEVLGSSIYAYNHIRTKQVVYSLTRNMDVSQVMILIANCECLQTMPNARRRTPRSWHSSSTTARRLSLRRSDATCGLPTSACISPRQISGLSLAKSPINDCEDCQYNAN
jgi:hypothetical protein